METIYQKKWAVITIAVFCSLLWGSAFPVLKISYPELQMDPNDPIAKLVFAGIRFLLAGVIVLVFLFFTNRKKLFVSRNKIGVLILLGLVQTSIQYFFFYNGLAKVTGMQGAILSSSGTFFTVLIAHFFYKNDRLNWQKVLGLVAGFAGIIVVNWGQEFQLHFSLTGEGFMIIAGLAGAIGTIMAKELATGIHPFALTGWQLTIGASLMLLIGLPNLERQAIVFTPLGTGLLLYSSLISAVAFMLWYQLLKYNKAGEISIYKFVIPVAGTFLSALFIPGEVLNLFILGSIALVSLGIVFINTPVKKDDFPHSETKYLKKNA